MLGDKIAYYRKQNSYTQEKLAELMNVSRQTIYKWEENISKPEIDKLKKLISILSISYNDLLN